jgi:putative DNA primase/helicase
MITTIVDPQFAARQFAASVLHRGFEQQALHRYCDADGRTLFCKIRAKHPDTGEKWIRPIHPVGDKWVMGEPTFQSHKPLYGLHLLRQSPANPVVVCEGELCADHLAKHGVLAVTSGGSDSAEAADWQPLSGRNVVIWPDHDEAGFRYADRVDEILHGLGCDVRIIDTIALGMKEKEDAVDWLERFPNATSAEILVLPVVAPSSLGTSTAGAIPSISAAPDLTESNPDPLTFSYDGGEFELTQTGLYYDHPKKPRKWLSGWLKVQAATRDESSKEWGRMVGIRDNDSVEHHLYVKAESLIGDANEVLRELASLGLAMATGTTVRDLLMAYLQNAPTEGRARSVERLGWHGEVYVIGDGAVGNDADKFISRNPTPPLFAQQGSLDEWRDFVAAAAAGNSRLVFATSCAFAGPLVHLAGMESGGFHLCGPSSTGKTTALKVAASVWGSPSKYIQQWRATANGLEGVASSHNDGLLILDELSQVDPVQGGEIAYLLANGQGKIRATRTGSNRPVATWRLLFLSSGEVGLWELLKQAGKQPKVGQEVRLADIDADAGAGWGAFQQLGSHSSAATFCDALTDASMRFYGVVGGEWLKAVVADRSRLVDLIPRQIQDFVAEVVPTGASGQTNRVARRFALVALAGELASHYGLTGWPEGESTQAAKACFASWLDRFGAVGDKEERNFLRNIVAYFNMYGDARFQSVDDPQPRLNKRTGFWRQGSSDGTREYLVPCESFVDELCCGLDSKRGAQILLKRGWIQADRSGRTTKRVRLPGHGQVRVYAFQSKMFEDDV